MLDKQGDVFNTTARYIGHGVNCVGVMGAGIAKTVRERYPTVYNEYRFLCERGALLPGGFFVYPENGTVIVNLATQYKPGPDATYEAVFNSLAGFSAKASLRKNAIKYGLRIAIPEIGAGIGGLEWPVVRQTIELVETIYPEIEYEVWHYDK